MAGPIRVVLSLIAVALAALVGTASASDSGHPEVSGTTVSDVTSSSATLKGAVHPKGNGATYVFEYGPTEAYGSQTPTAPVGSNAPGQPVSAAVTGLAASTTYHYRLVATNAQGPTRGPDRTFTTLAGPGPGGGSGDGSGGDSGSPTPPGGGNAPAPELHSSVVAAPGKGTLLVRRPGTSSFVSLAYGSELPIGTEVNATAGSLALTSALPNGSTQTGHFGGGRFLIRQGRRGYLDLYLRGRHCSSPTTAGLASAAATSKRRLWGRDHRGRFRTHGKNSHATVRGTRWSIADTCRGTLTRVSEGSVIVTDKTRRKRVVLEAGERYLARPRR